MWEVLRRQDDFEGLELPLTFVLVRVARARSMTATSGSVQGRAGQGSPKQTRARDAKEHSAAWQRRPAAVGVRAACASRGRATAQRVRVYRSNDAARALPSRACRPDAIEEHCSRSPMSSTRCSCGGGVHRGVLGRPRGGLQDPIALKTFYGQACAHNCTRSYQRDPRSARWGALSDRAPMATADAWDTGSCRVPWAGCGYLALDVLVCRGPSRFGGLTAM